MNFESNPQLASQLCREAQARLMSSVERLTEHEMRSRSLLLGWSIGHVLTHLARNADAHARRLTGSLNGEDVPKYAHGEEQRRREIADGAERPFKQIIADLRTSISQLEGVFVASAAAGWPNGGFLGGGHYGVAGCPAHRLREVEMHHVDLGLGYLPVDWPDEYVAWDLPILLSSVPERIGSPAERRSFMAWLAGRGPLDAHTTVAPW